MLADLRIELAADTARVLIANQRFNLRAEFLLLLREIIRNVLCERIGHVLA